MGPQCNRNVECIALSYRNKRRSNFCLYLFTFFSFLVLILSVTLFSTITFSKELPNSKTTFSLDQLEIDIWLENTDRLQELENQVVRLIQVDPYVARTHFLLAKIYIRRYQADPTDFIFLKKASEIGQQSYDLNPKYEYGRVITAEILNSIGQDQDALAILEIEDSKSQKSWRTELLKIKLLLEQTPPSVALQKLDTLIKRPKAIKEVISPTIINLISSYYKPEIQIELFEKWYKEHSLDTIKYSLAVAYSQVGQYKKASNIYKSIFHSKSAGLEAKINDAILDYRYLKKPQSGYQKLKSIKENQYEKLLHDNKIVLNTHLGIISLRNQNYKKSNDYFLSAMTLDESKERYSRFLKNIFLTEKRPKKFKEFLEYIVDEIPGQSFIYSLLGELEANNLKNYGSSIDAYTNAIILEPGNSSLYIAMGLSYYHLSKYSDALGLFTMATKVNPTDASAHYNMACVQSMLKMEDDAIKSLKHALYLDPKLEENAKSDTDFNNIKHHAFFAKFKKISH